MTDDHKPTADESGPGTPDNGGKLGVFAFLDSAKQKEQPPGETVAPPTRSRFDDESMATPLAQTAPVFTTTSTTTYKLSILVLEDYPEVMATVVGNIARYLHSMREQEDVSAEQHYIVNGITEINIIQAATPEQAFNVFGYYDPETQALTALHDLGDDHLVYGVFDVVLGHNLSGIDVLQIIKRHVPGFRAIVLTAQTNTEDEIARTVELADAYRKKQVSMDPERRYLLAQDIADKVNRIVDERRAAEQALKSKALVSTMPDLLAVVLDYYDFITGTHCRGVTDLALYIGQELKKGKRYRNRPEYADEYLDIEMLGFNAVLHDIGKVMAPKRILGKTGQFSKEETDLVGVVCDEVIRSLASWEEIPAAAREALVVRLAKFDISRERQQEIKQEGRLTPNELAVMRFHVVASELIRDDFRPYVSDKLVDPELVEYIMRLFDGLYHHEKPDGSGYPYGYSGQQYDGLPTAAKIILVADTYHALRSRRSYKPGMTHAVAVNILRELAGENRVISDCVDIISGLPAEVVNSVDEQNHQRISRLIARSRERVFSLGVKNPAQLLADLLSSNAIDPEDYREDE
ncbi:hypothetical protein JW859_13775 [bacterium]|nr:hypothetical protein [bacterium]